MGIIRLKNVSDVCISTICAVTVWADYNKTRPTANNENVAPKYKAFTHRAESAITPHLKIYTRLGKTPENYTFFFKAREKIRILFLVRGI